MFSCKLYLNRCSGQYEPMICHQLLDCFKGLSFPILDDMSFVQHTVVPLDTTKEANVFSNDIVGGHNEVVVLHLVA